MKPASLTLLILLLLSCRNSPTLNESTNSEKSPAWQHFAQLEADALKEAFLGVTTTDGLEADLFPIRSTGVSTMPIVNAAEELLATMDLDLTSRMSFAIEDDEWRKWCNVDNGIYDRQGVSLAEMSLFQKEAAFGLMEASLSAKGLQLSKDIMKTDQTLKEMHNGSANYGEDLYFFTMMGEPSPTQPWGWQLDGHHLVINYFVLGDQVVMSPVFMGAEPVITTTGKYKGNTLFQDEQNRGLALMQSLSPEFQRRATLSSEKTGDNNRAAANQDNLILDFEGLPVTELTQENKNQLQELIALYITNLREGHQQIKMEEVLEHMDETWFAWIGGTDDTGVFYYRIHSPVVLIEFDHQRPVGVSGEPRNRPTRNHIHTMVRTPNGNDYGKDLLRQHLQTHHGGGS